MAKRFFFLVFLFFTMTKVLTQDLTRQDADSMLSALSKSKHTIDRIDLLLNIAQFHIFKTGENKVDLDSAATYINNARELSKFENSSSVRGYLLLTESYLTKESGRNSEGREMAAKAVSILEPVGNKNYLGRAYYELSTYYDIDDSVQLSNRIGLVKQSIDAFQQTTNLKARAISLEMLGDLYNQQLNYRQALQALKQAVVIYDSIGYQKMQGAYVLLGEAYLYQEFYGQALSYLLKSLKTAHILHDTSMQLCQINNYLAILYNEIDRKDLAVKYWEDATEVARKYRDESSISLLAINTASAYNDLGKSEQASKILDLVPTINLTNNFTLTRFYIGYLRTYIGLKQYNKAQPYRDSLLKLAYNNLVSDRNRHNIYRLVATYYFGTAQYSKARYYLTKNIFLEPKIAGLLPVTQDYKLWYKLDSAQGNFKSAFNYLQLYKINTDSILSDSKIKQLQVLGIEYEVGMKEDSIKIKDQNITLLTQRNNLQVANLKQAAFVKKVTIAGIILAFVIIALLYRQYRHKQKSNTVITQKNEQLQHYLTEKEWLLKEIHHRVKNNLQIVMSLLESQSSYIDNEPALTAIHDSQHRVYAMSLIHQKLYNTENLSSINMSVYIRELSSYLADSFDIGQRIRFELAIEPLEMDVSQAVPLGLILNEAMTNSIKYAFPNEKGGVIKISLLNTNNNQYLLTISDNGIGIPSPLNNKKAGSLGMSLMAGLSEDLDGSFSIENSNGTVIKISFAHISNVKRQNTLTASLITNN